MSNPNPTPEQAAAAITEVLVAIIGFIKQPYVQPAYLMQQSIFNAIKTFKDTK
jgi:hypothetical protein